MLQIESKDQWYYNEKKELLGESLVELMELGGPELALMAIRDSALEWANHYKTELNKWETFLGNIPDNKIKHPASSEAVN